MNNDLNFNDFLKELTQLSQKYGIRIEGCGCCGSPALTPIKPEMMNGSYKIDEENENLTWIKNQTSN